ncbi:response regulator [Gracilibacillus sp. YIM 98692]|uniref:response regulator transcription factor n=1 Tax=Gracilibacillus sp. YIM 98692 TaxID=2663532 RepID=UPI0013D7865D|nr:response regulator [Gracilibacillus sp. YIM 98692]
MKSIIIDDEKHVREGIGLLAEWDKFGIHQVFEAKDGEDAKKIIMEHQPEIVFTDMNMPNVDGIALLKWLDSLGYLYKVIVISGYDDFHYMRNALYYGSFDYILKPIEPDVLNETLERAVDEWREQDLKDQSHLENNKVINAVKPIYWNHLFSGIIHKSNISKETIEKIEEEINVNVGAVSCTAALLHIRFLIEKIFHGDEDLAYFTLLNICHEVVKQEGVSFRNMNKPDEIVILIWDNQKANCLISKVHESIFTFSNMYGTCVRGKEMPNPAAAYDSALHTLLTFNLIQNKRRKQVMTHLDTDSRPVFHLLDYSQELSWALQSGSKVKIDEILNPIFKSMETTYNLSIEQLQVWEEQLEVLKNNWLKEYGINVKQLQARHDFWQEDGSFSFKLFQIEKRQEFYDLIELLYDINYQKSKSSMQEIEAFLQHHYDQDIKLQDIADRFFLSREYIARKFKQEYGETVIGYITKIRMEKAAELLKNPHLKIVDIAFKVGYQNEKYFSKLFKKREGVSPKKYRQMKVGDTK